MTEDRKKIGRPGSKEKILDAAHDTVMKHGTSHLTYEALAEKTGISRGGILYNFPSKEALLKAMISRHLAQISASKDALRNRDPGKRISSLEALIEYRLSRPRIDCRGATSMLAAMSENPSLLDPLKEATARDAEDIRQESSSPILAMVAWMALEGLLFQELFGTSPLTGKERASLIDTIKSMAQQTNDTL